MSKNRTKRQHYVPRFYLAYFADAEDMVWTYDTERNEVRAGTPENTAVETNFYSTKDEAGEYIDVLEEWLGGVEEKAAPLYPKLLMGEVLSDQEKADFAVFLSSLFTRTPAMITASAELKGYMAQHMSDVFLADRKRFDQVIDKFDAEHSKTTTPKERDDIFEFARDKSKYVMEVDRKAGLRAMGATDALTGIFFQMSWVVFHCERQHLITSDNTVVGLTPREDYHPIYGDGAFMNKRTYVTVPLTPSKLLELRWTDQTPPGLYEADRQRGRLYNRQRAYFSERYLYSSQRDAGIQALGQKHKTPGVRFAASGMDRLAPVEVKRRLGK